MLALLTMLLPGVVDIFKRLIPDPAARDQAEQEFQKILNETLAIQYKAEADKIESASKVIVAEASSGQWLASNWRPCLMFLFMILIANQFIFLPLINLILSFFGTHMDIPALPEHAWSLLEIGVGGYVVGRSGERIMKTHAESKVQVAKALNEKALADYLRKNVYGGTMTQEQWDAQIAAYEAASE